MIKEYELVIFGDRDNLQAAIKRELYKLKGSIFSYNSKAAYFEWPNQDRKYFLKLEDIEEAGKVTGMCFNKITFDLSFRDNDLVYYLLTRLRSF